MKRLYEIELEWGMKPTAEQRDLLTKLHGKPVEFEKDGVTLAWHYRTVQASLEEVGSLMPFTIKKALPYARYVADSVAEAMQPRVDVAAPVNERCNVVVAGNGMLQAVDTVKVATDYWAESLQRELDAGWRILAICVQPDQRRPDYVLGRIGGAR